MAILGVTIIGIVLGVALAMLTAGISAAVIEAAMVTAGFIIKDASDNWLICNIKYLNELRIEDTKHLLGNPAEVNIGSNDM